MPRGGKREGAGRPKGSKEAKTLEKEALRERVRQLVAERIDDMTLAQIESACGIKYFVAREKKTGKFVEIDQAEAKRMIRGEQSDYQLLDIWEKQPNVQAYTDLANRAMDKPKEQEQEVKITGEADLLAMLVEGRKRASER